MTTFADVSLPADALPAAGRILDEFDVTAELERVVPTGSATYHVWIVGPDAERAAATLADDPSVDGRVLDGDHPDRSLVRITPGDPPTLFGALEAADAMLVEAVGTRDGWSITIRFTDRASVSAFRERCRARGLSMELRGLTDEATPAPALAAGLTRAQRGALLAAFEAGYFDVSQDATLADVAARLGVSERAVSARLRGALTALLDLDSADDDDAGEE